MLASYLLSRTLVPTMVRLPAAGEARRATAESARRRRASSAASTPRFERGFERLRAAYVALLDWNAARTARAVFALFGVLVAERRWRCCRSSGRDFFPTVDAGQFRLHVRAPAGTRIEETEQLLRRGRGRDPPRSSRRTRSSWCSTTSACPTAATTWPSATAPPSAWPTARSWSRSSTDARSSTPDYVADAARASCREQFPELTFFFQPADIVSQILNFGLPAPIDVQVVGLQPQANLRDGARDRRADRDASRARSTCTCTRSSNVPELHVDVDRTRAAELGLTQHDVANSVLVSLARQRRRCRRTTGSIPSNGVNYLVAVQTPQHRIDSRRRADATPAASPRRSGRTPQLLGNLATVERARRRRRSSTTTTCSRSSTCTPTCRAATWAASPRDDRADRRRASEPSCRRATRITMRGQVESMELGLRRGWASGWSSRWCWSTC